MTLKNSTHDFDLWTDKTFWSGDNLIDMIGPLSSRRKVEESCSVKPFTMIPVAPLLLTENIWKGNYRFLLLFLA